MPWIDRCWPAQDAGTATDKMAPSNAKRSPSGVRGGALLPHLRPHPAVGPGLGCCGALQTRRDQRRSSVHGHLRDSASPIFKGLRPLHKLPNRAPVGLQNARRWHPCVTSGLHGDKISTETETVEFVCNSISFKIIRANMRHKNHQKSQAVFIYKLLSKRSKVICLNAWI